MNVKRRHQPSEAQHGEGKSLSATPVTKKSLPRRIFRGVMWSLFGIILFILLIPVLIYIPPVQNFLKDVACSIVSKSTGTEVSIDYFRLRFPLDVQLDNVLMRDEKGDTTMSVGNLTADVKILPLFHLDVDINKVDLNKAYYKMAAADSSMVMTLRAGNLRIEHGSEVNIKTGNIRLKRPSLSDANINVNINVWKQTPDSIKEPTPWTIAADELNLRNVNFSLEMLPTINRLDLHLSDAYLADALIDLRNNNISARKFESTEGKAVYLTPDATFIAANPVPVDTISPPSPPMTVSVDTISLNGKWSAIYGIAGVKPAAGFDPSFIEVSNVKLSLTDFFNRASEVRLPIKSLMANERSGLRITSGSGTISVDSIGIAIDSLRITTPYSAINVNADVSYALMALAPDAPVQLNANGYIGFPDIFAFMPSLKSTLSFLPHNRPLSFNIVADGNLSSIAISPFEASIPSYASIKAAGRIINPLDFNKMQGQLSLKGNLINSSGVNKMLTGSGLTIPSFSISGNVGIHGKRYNADIQLTSPNGDVAFDGFASLSPESYNASVSLHDFNLAAIMPSLGIGTISGHIIANGAGFNPMLPKAVTHISGDLSRLEYNRFNYAPTRLSADVSNGIYNLDIDITNPQLDLTLTGNASMHDSTYDLDLNANLRHVDVQALGFIQEECAGTGQINLMGTADFSHNIYNLNMTAGAINWLYAGNPIILPHALAANFLADASSVSLDITGQDANLSFEASEGLMPLIDRFASAATILSGQISNRRFDISVLQSAFPDFTIDFDAGGGGLISQFLNMSDITLGEIEGSLSNHEQISGNIRLLSLNTGSLLLDTITMNINQRDNMLDYKAHIGNRAANLPEFASINLSGYVGGNRGSLYAIQRNNKGEIGYRLGLTAALMDSTVALHLTPLNATIAYKKWEISDENHIDIGLGNEFRVNADLQASSGNSSIALHSGRTDDNLDALKVSIANLHIEDFLGMSVFAPPITGTLNTDMTIVNRGKLLTANGTAGITNLCYDRVSVGDIGLNVKAGMGFKGGFGGKIDVLLNKDVILTARGVSRTDSINQENTRIGLQLTHFPLKIANPFIGASIAQLSGELNGDMKMTGTFSSPLINGAINCDSVGVYVPMMGTTYTFDSQSPITVVNNLLRFDDFDIGCAGDNTLKLNGSVDARSISNILLDLSLKGNNVALVNNDRRSHSDIYGKLFVNLDASVKGSLSSFDVNAALSVLPSTNISYTLPTATSELQQSSSTTDVVKFVVFSDTVPSGKAPEPPAMTAMRVNANLSIVNGAEVTVNLSSNGTDKVQVNPYGNLTFTRSFMGDMRLAGQLNLSSGFVRYAPPVISEKKFDFSPETYVLWNGDIMNPILNIKATDHVKANVQQQGQNSRLIDFDVSLSVTGTLSAPKILFGLATNDDVTVQNELLSMTPEQQSNAAMNLMLTNTYTGQGVKATANLSGNPLYSFLSSQLNSWAAKNIRGVDLSFGIDQYDRTTASGESTTATSYSYQVSKSLLDNRFKIVIGGNYSTNASADESFVENLFSDISFEYMLKQTQNLNMYFKLFRHTGYESILEGEITETGLGFVMKRKLSTLRNLFRFTGRRKTVWTTDSTSTLQIDSITDNSNNHDSIPK